MKSYFKIIFSIFAAIVITITLLTAGLVALAVAALVLPVLFWWARKRVNKMEKEMRKHKTVVIEAEYEIIDEDEKDKGRK